MYKIYWRLNILTSSVWAALGPIISGYNTDVPTNLPRALFNDEQVSDGIDIFW